MGLFDRGKRAARKESENDVVGEDLIGRELMQAREHNWLLLVGVGEEEPYRQGRIIDVATGKEAMVVLRFYDPQDLAAGDEITAIFETPKWRYRFSTEVEEVLEKESYLCTFPDALRDGERRRSLRVRLRRNESVSVGAITDMFKGDAATGPLVEYSKVGFTFKPTKVMDVATQKVQVMTSRNFPEGKTFNVVRLKFPGMSREAEFSATVTRVTGTAPALLVSLDFEKIGKPELEAVGRSVDSRSARRPPVGSLFKDEQFDRQEGRSAEEEAGGGGAREESPPADSGRQAAAPPATASPATASPTADVSRQDGATASEAPGRGTEIVAPVLQTGVAALGSSPAAPVSAPPAARPAAEAPVIAPPVPGVVTGSRSILVVGGTALGRLQTKNALVSRGFDDVRMAGGGSEALRILDDLAPALIVVSTDMTDMPAMHMVRTVRSHPSLGSIPIIVITRALTPPDLVAIRSAGVDEIVIKPVEGSVLTDKAVKLIGPP